MYDRAGAATVYQTRTLHLLSVSLLLWSRTHKREMWRFLGAGEIHKYTNTQTQIRCQTAPVLMNKVWGFWERWRKHSGERDKSNNVPSCIGKSERSWREGASWSCIWSEQRQSRNDPVKVGAVIQNNKDGQVEVYQGAQLSQREVGKKSSLILPANLDL